MSPSQLNAFLDNLASKAPKPTQKRFGGKDVIIENEFWKGFKEADKSNLKSGSAITGYAGLHLTKTEKLIEFVDSSADLLKKTKLAGKGLGLLGTGLSVLEDYNDNKFGNGTIAKVGIGIATTFACGAFAPWALGYTVLDIGVGMATGTTITDRIAAGIDNVTKN